MSDVLEMEVFKVLVKHLSSHKDVAAVFGMIFLRQFYLSNIPVKNTKRKHKIAYFVYILVIIFFHFFCSAEVLFLLLLILNFFCDLKIVF